MRNAKCLRRFSVLILSFIFISVFLFRLPGPVNSPVQAQSSVPLSGDYIIHFKSSVDPTDLQNFCGRAGCALKENIPQINAAVVDLPSTGISTDNLFSGLKGVVSIEPDPIAVASEIPDDTGFKQEWGLQKIYAAQAWNITHGSDTVTIAILDSGIDSTHPDLASKIVAKHNFSDSPTEEDKYNHGTHVAGIAAAATDNRIGIAGVGYNSTLMNVKVLGDTGGGSYSWIIQGIIWAADNGADVINLSMSGDVDSPALKEAIDYAWNKGAIVVSAAANNGKSSPSYPAAYVHCIGVAATDENDKLCSYSDFGPWVDVAAPGLAYSTLPGNNYGIMGGTSMAAPYVSGLAALAFTVAKDENGDGKTNDEIKAAIQNGCDDIGSLKIGGGRINAYKTISSLLSNSVKTPDIDSWH